MKKLFPSRLKKVSNLKEYPRMAMMLFFLEESSQLKENLAISANGVSD